MNANIIGAIFKRNFVSYFSNPTGYVFICVFVLLSSFAAFWPAEFFAANLANLDQLNKVLPYIMLVFIPAITMSIWAEERRQGTDELLLTIPATDFDVVIGKYLAAVAIFSVSLSFSLVSNLIVLLSLGNPDVGLFISTYFGYWLVGLAMLAIGMAASFLTSNLTVGFILGAALNAPLVFAADADLIFSDPAWAATGRRWSLAEQFRDLGAGILSLAAVVYFLMLALVMIYVCMVLIGRRHWMGGKHGRSLAGHYLAHIVALVAVTFGINRLLQDSGLRYDMTDERLSSVSEETKGLLENLNPARPIQIEAFVSPQVPDDYIQTRLNLLSTLREIEERGGDKVVVKVYDVEPLSDVALRAEKQFGISGRVVGSESRGVERQDQIVLGAAIISGLQKVVVPFFGRDLPVEYELVRSLSTVANQQKPRLGVLTTDARMMGSDSQYDRSPRQPIIAELEKQYEVVKVDPNEAITEDYAVLLAVQPSSLSKDAMANFLAAVRSGQPTAIFEDPFPIWLGAPPTNQNAASEEGRASLDALWDTLGVTLVGTEGPRPRTGRARLARPPMLYHVVWQDHSPHKKYSHLPNEFVFVDYNAPRAEENVFSSESGISSGLQELLMVFPGGLSRTTEAKTHWMPLVRTGASSGYIGIDGIEEAFRLQASQGSEERQGLDKNLLQAFEQNHPLQHVLAAHITSQPSDAGDATPIATGARPQGGLNVVFVADIDMLSALFLNLRAEAVEETGLNFDNITFVLNVLDTLAGNDSVVELRKRRPAHRTLDKIEQQIMAARVAADEALAASKAAWKADLDAAEAAMVKAVDDAKAKVAALEAKGALMRNELQAAQAQLAARIQDEQQRLTAKKQQNNRERQRTIRETELERDRAIREIQDSAKLRAVLVPPIFPFLIGAFVFFHRRAREREGVSQSRLR